MPHPTDPVADPADSLKAALQSMRIEEHAIRQARDAVGPDLPAALGVLGASKGRIIVSGIGKSGHIGAKIAATLASTGNPAQFVHSTEALHGDSGMAVQGDAAILISYSGQTAEVCQFAAMLADDLIPIIALTAQKNSMLASLATVTLSIAVAREADPLGLAPTASAAATLAVGDALAAGLMTTRNFQACDFGKRHPGGSLGEKLGVSDQKKSEAL